MALRSWICRDGRNSNHLQSKSAQIVRGSDFQQLALPGNKQPLGAGWVGGDGFQCCAWGYEGRFDMQFLRGVIAVTAKLFGSFYNFGTWSRSETLWPRWPILFRQIQTAPGGFTKCTTAAIGEMFVIRSVAGCESLGRMEKFSVLQNVKRRPIDGFGFALAPIP